MGQRTPVDGRSIETDGGEYPREDEIIDSIEELRAQKSPFERLFSPRSKAAILDVLLEEGGNPVTVQEMTERSDEISTSSFNRQRDDLLEYGVMIEAGQKGNAQTYALDVDHPVAQALKMVENVITWGKTPLLLDEEYLGHPGESSDR